MKELISCIKNLPKHFKESLVNLWRNGAMSFSSIFAVTITLLLIGVISVLALNVQDISANIEDGVRIYVKLERSIDENAEKEVGNQIKKLKDYIDAHYMHSYAEFIGFTPDIEGLYRSIDCLLLPTVTREAFGLVICEAMYCGVPVITSGSGAQREIIDDGESGFIVDPLNEHSLQQAMEHVMSDDVNLPNIITKARQVVEQRFIVNRVADELVTIIDNLH